MDSICDIFSPMSRMTFAHKRLGENEIAMQSSLSDGGRQTIQLKVKLKPNSPHSGWNIDHQHWRHSQSGKQRRRF
jgi:hypothetical protein